MSMFLPGEVTAELPPELAGRLDIRTAEITGSTNLDVRALAEAGAPEGTVIAAGGQTAGRGRLGRSFYSPQDGGLYMSVLLRPALPVADSLAMTVCAASATAEAVEELTGKKAGIKWVNDIYIDGRKAVGILTEASVETDGRINYAVTGIGINVTDMGFPEELREKAGTIGGSAELRPKLAAAVLRRFFAYYDRLPDKGYLSGYRRRSILTGKTIEYERGGTLYTAKAVGIDDEAKLIVITPQGGELHLGSGEVNIIIGNGEQ
ncbi:MAG: biotin--[acetyl-CoA-carboxylase] ligase [Ruminiclostridium sp.]|nr:biotin--[acetyl-CoA-carboxylase] ligase [Ruminiclostridium sp.]